MDIQTLAKSHFKKFVYVILQLLLKERIQFDLIVGGGDSGIAMVKFVELLYVNLGLPFPKTLVLPIYRHVDEAETILFDNSIFMPEVKGVLSSIIKIQKVLFVDDEIGSGSVAKNLLQLILSAASGEVIHKPLEYHIVAEDHGFRWNMTENVTIKFYPHAKKTADLWSMLSRMSDPKIMNELSRVFPKSENQYKYATNTLLGLPVKEFAEGRPRFTNKYLQLAKQKSPKLSLWQSDFKKLLEELIDEAVTKHPAYSPHSNR